MKDFSNTNKRWVTSLNEIKELLNSKDVLDITSLFKKHRMHTDWGTFLVKNKFIFRNDFKVYRWNNEKPQIGKPTLNKYREFRDSNKTIKQTTLPFNMGGKMTTRPKIGCKLTPPPHIIKDAMKGTTTIVPQGKEKEFIESTKVAQPQQRRQFILIILWGLLTIKF
jgi:hypothetical protein